MTHNKLPGLEEEDSTKRVFDYGAGIQRYIDSGKNKVLRPDQVGLFDKIQQFMASPGELRGYVQSPTGTGKTVVFVELSKAILEARLENGQSPKILVVTPKIDLVHQTLGRTGEKGYGKFAPDLNVSAFFQDSTEQDRRTLQDSDVVVTTYKSMALMGKHKQLEKRTPKEVDKAIEASLDTFVEYNGSTFRALPGESNTLGMQLISAEAQLFHSDISYKTTDESLLDMFDVFILDEVHHVLGEASGKVVESIPGHKPIVGFTATPDANQKRKVESRLPRKIYTLPFSEAIDMGLLSPLTPIGVKSSISMVDRDIFDTEGEYLDEKISHLGSSAVRNSLITDIAKVFADAKIGTVVSCLPGNEALHTRLLAKQMREAGIKAEAVYGKVNSLERQRIYERFEKGETDVLTYVDVLGEGWDSDRAKAIINGRPTRSLIKAQQRLGRIVRPGGFALSVDIIDQYDKFNPPLYASDLLDEEAVDKGAVFGQLTPEQEAQKNAILLEIGRVADIATALPADYSNFHARLSEYTPIKSGNLASSRGKSYSVSKRVIKELEGLSDEILDKLWTDSGQSPDVIEGVSGYTIRRTYERSESERLIGLIPENNPAKALREKDNSRWMSAQGLVALFGNRYPGLDEKIMRRVVNESRDLLEWRPLRYREPGQGSSHRPFVYKAYKIDESSIELIDQQLSDYFSVVEQLEKEQKQLKKRVVKE